jgi:Na+-transporting methylmalonyl-CoA/oxaloacetate decarboxylase gamma subunit
MITALYLAATPSPTTTATSEVDADLVTPGLWGFVMLFVLAVAVYFLGRSMARRIQRMNHRARVEAQEAAEAENAPEKSPQE